MKFDLNHQKLQLKNGAQIYFVSIPYAQTVTTMAIVNAGPRYDPPQKIGLSHLIEHIKLRNTDPWKNGTSLSYQIEEVGSSPSGFTYFETNKYWINLIPEYSPQGVEFLCRILNAGKYGDAIVEKEKKTVLEELRIIESNSNKKIWEVWTEHIFRGTDLGNGYIGDSSTLQRIDKNDVSSFTDTWYTSNRTTFIVTGNISAATRKKIVLLVETAMNHRVNKIISNSGKLNKIPSKDPIRVEKSSTKTLTVVMGFRTVSVIQSDQAVFKLIQSYLNGGLRSRLGQKLILGGLVYFVNSFVYHLSDTGYFSILFTSLPSNLNTILKVIYKEIGELKDGNIDQQRLESAKRYTIFQQRLQLDSPQGVANFYARQCPYSNDHILNPQEEDAQISQVTQRELCEATKRYFTFEALRIAVVGDVEKSAVSLDF